MLLYRLFSISGLSNADCSQLEAMTEPLPKSTFIERSREPSVISPMLLASAEPSKSESGIASMIGIARRQVFVIIGITITFFSYSAWQTLNEATQYEGSFQILVEPVNVENANLAAPTGTESNRQRQSLDYPTQIAILKSPELIGEVVADLQSSYPGINYGQLTSQINIRRLGDTKLLQISYDSNSADKAQLVLNALADRYLQYSLNERQTYLRQGLQFVDEQLETLRSQLDELQNRLESFQRQNSIVDPTTLSNQVSAQAASLGQRQQELEQEIVIVQSEASLLRQDQGEQVALEQDAAYQSLKEQIREIDAQIAVELTRLGPDNPTIESLERQRDNLLPLLQQQAEQVMDNRLAGTAVRTQSLQTQLQSVRSAQDDLASQLQEIPALTRRYVTLQKEIEITNASLTDFLETQQSLQIESAQREIPWEIVREPTVVPIDSDTFQSLMTALLTGLALGGAVAFAIDKLDNTYHTAEQLRAAVNLPVLGTLPLNHSPGSGHRDASAEFVESLRVINTNLQMSRTARRVHTITVSSASSGDGKSTLALNWAETATSMGQRVLLIDGVLRNPMLHRSLNISNEIGLSNLLTGNAEPPDGLQQVWPDKKLYALTGGSPTSNPVNLLGSPKMQQILSYYKKFYDLIIIDAPPLSGFADANIINQKTDGLVLVARLDQTDKTLLQQTIADLQGNNMSVLGIVINGHK